MMSSVNKFKISSILEKLDDDILNSIPLRFDPNIEFSDDEDDDDRQVKSVSRENMSDMDTASSDSEYISQNLVNKQTAAADILEEKQDIHLHKSIQSANVRKLYPSEYGHHKKDGTGILTQVSSSESSYLKFPHDSKIRKNAGFTPRHSGSNILETLGIINLNRDKMYVDKENRFLNSESFPVLESNARSMPLKIKALPKSKNSYTHKFSTPSQEDCLTIDSNRYNPNIVHDTASKEVQGISKAQNYLPSHLPSHSVKTNVVNDRLFSCASERSHRINSHVHPALKTPIIKYHQYLPNDNSVEFKNTFDSRNLKLEPSNIRLEKPFNMTSNSEKDQYVNNKALHAASNMFEAGRKENFIYSFHNVTGKDRGNEDNSSSASLKIATDSGKFCDNTQINACKENIELFSGSQKLLSNAHNRHFEKDFSHGKSGTNNVKSRDEFLSNELKSSLHIPHGGTNYPVIKSASSSDTGDNVSSRYSNQLQGSERITESSKSINSYRATATKIAEDSSKVVQKELVEMVKVSPHQQCANQESKSLHVSKTIANTDSQMPSNKVPNNCIQVNGKSYTLLSLLGKGGSSQVYAVHDPETKTILAVKRVTLANTETSIREGYKNEVALLKKLQGNNRVIKMYDFEYHDDELLLVLEKGDTDLAHFIRNKMKIQPLTPVTIKFYWSQMLEAVAEIHRLGIIHSDLKPANFLLVAGQLKLIDFGIASSVQTDMTSIFKDSQVGTLHFMSPEAITDSEANYTKGDRQHPVIKISVKSDVWSLGCILYNLVYGHTPFHNIQSIYGKIKAITDHNFVIPFPPLDDTALLDVMKCCLKRDPKERASVEELLKHPYLTAETQNNISQKNLKDVVAQMQSLTPRRIGVIAQLVKNLHSGDQAKRDDLF